MARVVALMITGTLLLVPLSRLHAGNFADTYGFSAKGLSMGNAMTAIADDWSSVWYNMAGLGRTPVHLGMIPGEDEAPAVHRNEIALSYFYTVSGHTLNGVAPWRKDEALKQLDFGVIIFGLTLDVTSAVKIPKRFISTIRLGIAMGNTQDGDLVKVYDVNPATHTFMRFGRRAQKGMILAGLGLGFLDDLFGIGLGANMTFNGKGRLNMYEVLVAPGVQVPRQETQMNLGFTAGLLAGVYFSPGTLFPAVRGLTFGATYRMKTKVDVSPFEAHAFLLVGGVELIFDLSIIDYFTPHLFTVGTAYTIGKRATVSFDFEYQLWSEHSFPASRGLANLPSFNDVWMVRLGGEVLATRWLTATLGYYYQPSMVPDSMARGFANVLDNDKHVFSAGANFRIPQLGFTGGPAFVNLAYQLQYLVERDVHKSAAAYDPVLNPDYDYGGFAHTFMISLSMQI